MFGKTINQTSPAPPETMPQTIKDYLDYKYTSSKHVRVVDGLMEAKKTRPLWEVIGKVINFWASLRPKEYESYIIHLRSIKETRKNTRVGKASFRGISHDKGTGGYLNYTLDIPELVYFLIRRLYDNDELRMDRKFFAAFARKFPKFRVSEKA